jgi:Tfp pilus assembly protein PilN
MIRTNLSTRPFYNERAVRLWLLVAAIVVAAATLFNVARVLQYSRSDTELATQASRDEARAADLRATAARFRASVDPREIEFAFTEARQANELIDRRTFSWTDLFNRFETTLPDNVRVVAVRPKIDAKRGIVLQIDVVARSVEDVGNFMEHLEATGAFVDLLSTEEHFNDQNQLEASLETVYVPSAAGTEGAKRP